MSEKRFLPGTNPEWRLELPDEDYNSLVAKGGNHDNGYNFDERIEEDDDEEGEDGDEGQFERAIRHELSLEEKKALMGYFDDRGGKSEYDAYGIFITEVPEEEPMSLTVEQMTAKVPEAYYLSTADNGVGLDPQNEWQAGSLARIDVANTPIVFKNRSFTHLRWFGGREVKDDRETEESLYCRYYLCPELAQLPEIIPKLLEKYQEKGLPLMAKFANSNERNDRIVVYCDKDSAEGQLEALRALMAENPELFQRMGRNRLWGQIEGLEGVYFGQENPYAHYSYTEDRARVVGSAAQILSGLRERGTEPTDEAVETIFDLSCLARRVDVRSWGEYISQTDEGQEAAHDQAAVLLEMVEQPEEIGFLLEEIEDWGAFERLFGGLRSVLPREVWREHFAKLRELKKRSQE